MNNSVPTNLIVWMKMTNCSKDNNLPKLMQGEIGHHLNRPISITGIKSIINNLRKEKAGGPGRFTNEPYHIF